VEVIIVVTLAGVTAERPTGPVRPSLAAARPPMTAADLARLDAATVISGSERALPRNLHS